MTQHNTQVEDFKAARRSAFLRRMEAKLRMKEAMQEHGRSHRADRFSDFN